jgi:phosphate:Na+ symporter
MDTVFNIGSIFGGLGLFLLAVTMITDGLKLAAGNALRDLLWRWTNSPTRGIGSGLAITALVQSSSAVTVATIGFVNAGFLTLYQALGVIYGANIGTTMTGWLVAIVGFKIKVELFALPLIGLGMSLRLLAGGRRLGALGEALAGFGLFFIGIQVLTTAFEGLAGTISMESLAAHGLLGTLLFVGVGFLMTVLTQSSSAAIAIILTAATGGMLQLSSAAAMVIGANVGTTSTAALAVIGATPNAKRVAAAHILFNGATGLVALLMLPIMLWVVRQTSDFLGLEDVPAVTLALFHTAFNLLGVILMWPATTRLASFLGSRFTTAEEIESRPRYLDKTIAVSPALALSALTMELRRVGAIAQRIGKGVLSAEFAESRRLRGDRDAALSLVNAIGDFSTLLGRGVLPTDIGTRLPNVLRAARYFTACAELAVAVAKEQITLPGLEDEALAQRLAEFKSDVVALLDAADIGAGEYAASEDSARLRAVHDSYQQLKAAILDAGVRRHIEIPNMAVVLEQLSRIRRMAEQYEKGARYLADLEAYVALVTANDKQPAEAVPAEDIAAESAIESAGEEREAG